MAGTFKTMNKIRPGAYINFENIPEQLMGVGSRGVATMPVIANWGESGKLIELMPVDMINGNFERLFGDTDRLIFELMLHGASKALVYKANAGTKATKVIGGITCTAKHGGTFGNKIGVAVLDGGVVETYVDGVKADKQTVADISKLVSNDYIDFSGSGAPTKTAITLLTGGANGAANYTDYFALLPTKRWNTLACIDSAMDTQAIALVKQMREDGMSVQAVVGTSLENVTKYDTEAVIEAVQKTAIGDTEVSTLQGTAYLAGITAGANVNESNTARVTPFTRIVDELTNSQTEEQLLKGRFVYSYTADGEVKCEQDINTLTTFTPTKGKMFSKNRVIRVLDEISNQITYIFEKSYMGKISNNDIGRTTLKADLVGYFNELQGLQAIKNFTAEDIVIEAGLEIDEIIVTANIQPVDSIEKLYMTVKLS